MAKWIKPTVDTKFHVDFSWWEETGRNFRVDLLGHLCDSCQARYKEYRNAELIDWIDARTAEVRQVDGLWHSLRVCCSTKPDFINEYTPLATAAFRTFLANANEPMTPIELQARLGRPADTILRTIGGAHTYNGIKPVNDSEAPRLPKRRAKEGKEATS